ncbi:hypothetical protein RB595_007695 [Gaeumannomyces hyphopodioides]
MRTNILSLALVSLLGVASALPIGEQPQDRNRLLRDFTNTHGTGSRLTRRADPELSNTQGDDGQAGAQALARAGGKPGIAYAPFKKDHNCKSAKEVQADFDNVLKDYSMVRLYGVECDQVAKALEGAKKHKMKLFLGFYSSEPNKIEEEFKSMNKQLNGDWSLVDTVSFGNENVERLTNMGKDQRVASVLAGLKQVRGLLKGTSFKGSVVSVETWVAARDNPSILQNSDYCAVNFHPFFDQGGVTAEKAGDFIAQKIQTDLKPKCGGKRVVITETGWPHAGTAHHGAVPGLKQQAAAIASIKGAVPAADLILFSPFDDEWKQNNAATWNAEQFWGIAGKKSG